MNALALHYVGQGDTCGEHSNPYFTTLRLRAHVFNHLQCIGPTVVGDDDSLKGRHTLKTPKSGNLDTAYDSNRGRVFGSRRPNPMLPMGRQGITPALDPYIPDKGLPKCQ